MSAFADRATVAGFLIAIFAPLADQTMRSDEARGPAPEQRAAAPLPAFPQRLDEWTRFPERYEAHHADVFGLRDVLLRWHSLLKLLVFGVSPTDEVVLGKDDWMFFTGDRSIEVYRGLAPLSERELEAWAEMLKSHRDHLADLGIEHLFVIAPNKESVFEERMPARFNRVGPTRMDQLASWLAEHTDFEILDLRNALRAERDAHPEDPHLYFPLGTHWDGKGALVGCREILSRLSRRFPSLAPRGAPVCETLRVKGDTWARAMYVEDLFEQSEVACDFAGANDGADAGAGARTFSARPPRRARVVVAGRPGAGARRVTEVDDPKLPRAVLFHDSFGTYVQPILEERFSHLASYWQPEFDTTLWEVERPDVVIELFVERFLVTFSPMDNVARASESSRLAFARSSRTLLALDLAQEPPPLEAEGKTSFENIGDAVEIRTRAPTDLVLLPGFAIPDDGKLLFKVELDSPVATTFELLYKLEGDKRYRRARSRQIELAHGSNELYFRLNQTGIVGQLAIRPGRIAATYVLRALEVRAVE